MGIPFLACMIATASFYHLPPRLLPVIQAVEGGRPGVVQTNTNGSADLGVMQINSVWVPPLAHATGLSPDAVRSRLIGEPCFNIAAAGAIMRLYLNEAHGDLMMAVGYYHSHTSDLALPYRTKVLAAAGMMFHPVKTPAPAPAFSRP